MIQCNKFILSLQDNVCILASKNVCCIAANIMIYNVFLSLDLSMGILFITRRFLYSV